MNWKRIEPGSYRAESGGFVALIDRADSGQWFWTVQRNGGGTSGGLQYSLKGAKSAAFLAVFKSRNAA
jgi:hypothetical protein